MYQDGEYDLAGTIVGVAEKSKLITGAKVAKGDVLLALPSTGLHTNGYSLARKILFEVAGLQPDSYVSDFGQTVAEELLTVHRTYLKPIRALHEAGVLKAAVHVTGGGITENTPRVLPKGLGARVDLKAWKVPAVFEMLRIAGNVPEDDWRRTFNLGIGMILVVAAAKADRAMTILSKLREKPFPLGEVVKLKRNAARVEYE
jgi:phosphoribosylformylglycinamidine cyclo-ligase